MRVIVEEQAILRQRRHLPENVPPAFLNLTHTIAQKYRAGQVSEDFLLDKVEIEVPLTPEQRARLAGELMHNVLDVTTLFWRAGHHDIDGVEELLAESDKAIAEAIVARREDSLEVDYEEMKGLALFDQHTRDRVYAAAERGMLPNAMLKSLQSEMYVTLPARVERLLDWNDRHLVLTQEGKIAVGPGRSR